MACPRCSYHLLRQSNSEFPRRLRGPERSAGGLSRGRRANDPATRDLGSPIRGHCHAARRNRGWCRGMRRRKLLSDAGSDARWGAGLDAGSGAPWRALGRPEFGRLGRSAPGRLPAGGRTPPGGRGCSAGAGRRRDDCRRRDGPHRVSRRLDGCLHRGGPRQASRHRGRLPAPGLPPPGRPKFGGRLCAGGRSACRRANDASASKRVTAASTARIWPESAAASAPTSPISSSRSPRPPPRSARERA